MNGKECDIELQEKIAEHRKDGVITCGPECWCWSAVGTICLYQSALEANKLAIKKIELTQERITNLVDVIGNIDKTCGI